MKHERKTLFGSRLVGVCLVVAVIGIIMCCYGHAALNSNLYISGEAVVSGGKPLDELTYMQEMTPGGCAVTDEGKTKQLIDKRDGKTYWVAKMRDGNCWMTQNLDYDIPAVLNDDGVTSDVAVTNYAVEVKKINNPTEWVTNSLSEYDKYSEYYELGDYYYLGPNGTHAQGTACNLIQAEDTLTKCKQFATEGDEHYHVGNIYSWSAATAGTGDVMGGSMFGKDAPGSVCPAGWRLPLSGTDTQNKTAPWSNDKSFAKLFESYGWTWDGVYRATTLHGGTEYYLYNAPFYFVYGGSGNSKAIQNFGYAGYYWSSTKQTSGKSFFAMFLGNFNPSGAGLNSYGNSVRCVAR